MLFYSMWDRQLAEKQSLPTIIRGVERVGPPGGEISGGDHRGKLPGGVHQGEIPGRKSPRPGSTLGKFP